jgi:hypothetical protein
MTYMPTFVLQIVMNMAEDDPRRMDEIRKYAAIYGRFDCKRKPEKPLTLHEVSSSVRLMFSVWVLHGRSLEVGLMFSVWVIYRTYLEVRLMFSVWVMHSRSL